MAEQKFDFKKEFKNIYLQKTQPVIVEVPPMTYLCVDGKGNPNTTQEYKDALAILYGLSYTIKMSKMDGTQPVGYFDYVVPPLEGCGGWKTEKASTGSISRIRPGSAGPP